MSRPSSRAYGALGQDAGYSALEMDSDRRLDGTIDDLTAMTNDPDRMDAFAKYNQFIHRVRLIDKAHEWRLRTLPFGGRTCNLQWLIYLCAVALLVLSILSFLVDIVYAYIVLFLDVVFLVFHLCCYIFVMRHNLYELGTFAPSASRNPFNRGFDFQDGRIVVTDSMKPWILNRIVRTSKQDAKKIQGVPEKTLKYISHHILDDRSAFISFLSRRFLREFFVKPTRIVACLTASFAFDVVAWLAFSLAYRHFR